ncbi:MAG: metallophosphoesterase family protein, partial [Pirellulaceae bacterium]
VQADLRATAKKTIVFAHQRLDLAGKHAVRNAAAVREVLEASGKVLAVLQGHSHGNDYQEIHGIHYCTLVAMVEGSGPENNGYAVMDILADQTICIHGYRQQRAYQWS